MRTAIAALAALCVVGCVQGTALDSPTPSTSSSEHNGSPVASIALSPAAISGKPGQAIALAVSVVNANGQRDTSAQVKWTSSNQAIATVSDSGMVTLVAAGAAQISASAGGVSATAQATVSSAPAPVSTVRVSPATVSLTPGQYTPLSAVPLDASGNQLTGQTVTWSSSNTSIATVSSSGIVTAVAVGAAVISATAGGISGSAHVTVATASPAAVASVTISPATTSLTVGGTAQLSATDKDANGNVLAGRAVTWVSSNSSVVSINSNGEVTAVAAGSATITATSGGKNGTATVSVSQAAVASVKVTPGTENMTPGQTAQLTATAYDASGNVLTGRSVTWASSPASVATVSGTGLVKAVAVGTATLTATIGGQSGTSSVTVGPAPVAAVSVTPSQASIGVGQNQQLTASATTAAGTAATGVSYTWSSSNSGTAAVSSSGLVTGMAAGSATITVSAGGKSATAAIAVTSSSPAPVASVSVTPGSSTLTVGNTVQLTATDKSSSGATTTGTTPTWSSSNTNVATVSGSGLVTAKGAGSAAITATSSSKSGTATVNVSAGSSGGSGGGASNEPSGMTKITERPFNSVVEDGWGTPYQVQSGAASIVQDGSAPKSPSSVMQVTYPVGLQGGHMPISQDFFFSGGQTSFYGVMWIKISSNFVGNGAGVNKIFYMWTDDGGGAGGPTWYLSAQGAGSANFEPEVRTQGTAPAEDYGPNVSGQTGYTFPRNTWVKWEWYITNNTPGNADGIVRMWMNGVKVADYNNVKVSTSSSQTHFNEFQLTPVWGGGGGTITSPQYLWIDDVYASGR